MHEALKISIVFLLLGKSQPQGMRKPDFLKQESEEKWFTTERNKETQEVFRIEMERLSDKFLDLLNQKLTICDSRMEMMERTIANLSETVRDKLTFIELKQENSTSDSPETSLFQNSMSEVGTKSPREQHFSVVANSTEINGRFGTIEFNPSLNSTLFRQHWMIVAPNTTSTKFSIHDNNLGPNYQLSVTGISVSGGSDLFYISSRTPNATEFTVEGTVTVVELTFISETDGLLSPSFKLVYRTLTESGSILAGSSQVITEEGSQIVSFPTENKENYPYNTFSAILIAPPSGEEFKITLKYLDTEMCLNCMCDYLKVFSFGGYSNRPSAVTWGRGHGRKYCGGLGHTSEAIGCYSAALLFFKSDGSNAGKGYKVEIQPE